VVSLGTTDLETAKKLLPAETIKATRAIEAARLTLQRGPEATVERVSTRIVGDYRKANPFGPERRGERANSPRLTCSQTSLSGWKRSRPLSKYGRRSPLFVPC
jgi:hypothetical protein